MCVFYLARPDTTSNENSCWDVENAFFLEIRKLMNEALKVINW